MQIRIGSRVSGAALAGVLAGIAIGGLLVGVAWQCDARAADAGAVVDVGPLDDYMSAGDFPPILWARDHFYLVKTEAGELRAFYVYPPHAQLHERPGCAVEWFKALPPTDWTNVFRDRCFGATFNRDGDKLFGPSARGLDQFPVTVKDGRILVDTRRLRCAGAGVCRRL